MSATRFRIDAENVVHEEVDGELIAIDLTGGSYYSLSGSGPAIWALLVPGAAEAEICNALVARFDADPETIRSEVSALLEKLLESKLAVAAENVPEGPPVDNSRGGEKPPFEPPRFERYTDMKDYFLLDPIHEVDPAGWPQPAA